MIVVLLKIVEIKVRKLSRTYIQLTLGRLQQWSIRSMIVSLRCNSYDIQGTWEGRTKMNLAFSLKSGQYYWRYLIFSHSAFTTAYEKANKGQSANFSCCLEGGNLISTAEPVITLYRKMVSESYTQVQGIKRIGNGAHRNSEFLFTLADVKVGEMFYCSLSDVNIFWSDKITADGEFSKCINALYSARGSLI